MEDCDQSLSGGQDIHVVNDSNSSCVDKKNNFESLHKIVFQPIIDSNLKSKNVLKQNAGKFIGKNECSNEDYLKFYSNDQHNTWKNVHSKHHSIICNYCGKSGHISHTCYIRRNSNVKINLFGFLKDKQSPILTIKDPSISGYQNVHIVFYVYRMIWKSMDIWVQRR